ncbi:MAG: SWIM zinc finger family protein [Anaerolineae bacterium]|nr:SWIM zinc finger family protein [Anaerolineae bacterium]
MWDYFPKKRATIRVENGIKLSNEKGEIGAKWWSKRWLAVLESFGLGERLTRGRRYARNGQVISLDIAAGKVLASVQGSMRTPYHIQIDLMPLSDRQWDIVIEHMAQKAAFAAKLLAGEMPQAIEEAFQSAQVSLFPQKNSEFKTNCSCPDWSNPCKHVAAVYYVMADQFDRDPFLLFKLRGRNASQIIEALRKKRGSKTTTPAALVEQPLDLIEHVPALEDDLAAFWALGQPLDGLNIQLNPPVAPLFMLRRLGPAPMSAGGPMLDSALARMYRLLE